MLQLSSPITIDEFIELENPDLNSPGVYVIQTLSNIGRFLGSDTRGIVYIGESNDVKRRVDNFRTSDHQATDFFFQNKSLARRFLSNDINEENIPKMSSFVGRLYVRHLIAEGEAKAKEIEKALLFAYVFEFGEVPPMNNSLPKRDETPSKTVTDWYRKQLFEG